MMPLLGDFLKMYLILSFHIILRRALTDCMQCTQAGVHRSTETLLMDQHRRQQGGEARSAGGWATVTVFMPLPGCNNMHISLKYAVDVWGQHSGTVISC